jgi:chromosome partitioning protein
MEDEPIPLKVAAERFGVTYDRLRRAAYDERLVAQRKGHEWLVRPSEVKRFLREGGKRPMLGSVEHRGRAAGKGPGMARVIAIAIVKGGVGKTTTALNLGAALAEQRQRVLLVDCDPQCSLSLSLGVEVRDVEHTLSGLITEYLSTYDAQLEQAILPTSIGVDLVPSSIRLGRVDKELNFATQREYVLQKLLSPVVPRYDIVLLDTMPATNNLVTNALVAAQEVVIPLEPEYLAVESLAMTLEDVEQVRRSGLNPELVVTGILLTQVDQRTVLHREVIEYTRTEFGGRAPVFETVVKKSVRFPESQTRHQSILQYEPHGEGASAYRALAQEVLHG